MYFSVNVADCELNEAPGQVALCLINGQNVKYITLC